VKPRSRYNDEDISYPVATAGEAIKSQSNCEVTMMKESVTLLQLSGFEDAQLCGF